MRCVRARQLLHLNREGELSDALRNDLLRHASRCPECAAELSLIKKTEKTFSSLRGAEPCLANPPGLTAAIMNRVHSGAEPARRLSAFIPHFMSFRVQRAIHVACVMVVAAFFLETIMDARRMTQLDERLSHVRPTATAKDARPPRSLSEAKEMLRSLEAGLGPLDGNLRIGPFGQATVMDRLRAKYPELFTVTVDDGLDDRERAILATQGRAFLNEMELLVRIGEISHER